MIDLLFAWDREGSEMFITTAAVYENGGKIMYRKSLDCEFRHSHPPKMHKTTYEQEEGDHRDTVSIPYLLCDSEGVKT